MQSGRGVDTAREHWPGSRGLRCCFSQPCAVFNRSKVVSPCAKGAHSLAHECRAWHGSGHCWEALAWQQGSEVFPFPGVACVRLRLWSGGCIMHNLLSYSPVPKCRLQASLAGTSSRVCCVCCSIGWYCCVQYQAACASTVGGVGIWSAPNGFHGATAVVQIQSSGVPRHGWSLSFCVCLFARDWFRLVQHGTLL